MTPARTILALVVPAQQSPRPTGSSAVGELLLWLGALIGLVLIGGAVLMALRSRLSRDKPDDDRSDASSMLESLRRMRERGEISIEEFESTRARLVGRAAGQSPARAEGPITSDTSENHGPGAGSDAGARRDGRWQAKPGLDLAGDPLPTPREPGPETDPGET